MNIKEFGNSEAPQAAIACERCRRQLARRPQHGIAGFIRRFSGSTLIDQLTDSDTAWVMARTHARTRKGHHIEVYYFSKDSPLARDQVERLKNLNLWPYE